MLQESMFLSDRLHELTSERSTQQIMKNSIAKSGIKNHQRYILFVILMRHIFLRTELIFTLYKSFFGIAISEHRRNIDIFIAYFQ